MWIDVYRGGSSATGVAPPIFSFGKGHPAACTAVHAGWHEGAAGVTANHRLVTGGTALAAFINCFVMRHGMSNVNAYKLTLHTIAVSPCVMRGALAQTVQTCCVLG